MTRPLPGPSLPMPGPDAWPITVPVEPCCGVLVGEEHDCWSFFADALAAFSAPILLPPHTDLPIRTDSALQVWRADGEWVEAMRPPYRWHATPDAIEVTL